MMADQRHEFEAVRRLESDAVGTPGHRRFRVIVQSGDETAFLWLEKEQLQALGLAVDQLLTPVKAVWTRDAQNSAPPTPERKSFDGLASIELQVSRLGLGFDEESKTFIIVAHDSGSDPDDPPTFRCRCSRRQLSHLSESITEVTASGRPRCPLCGSPLDGGPHFCPGSNGHSH
jgi:uncharacterized repeat protein (TIGR03847 family)